MSNSNYTLTLQASKRYIATIDGVRYVGDHIFNRKSTVVSHIDYHLRLFFKVLMFQVSDWWRSILLPRFRGWAGIRPIQQASGGVGYNIDYSWLVLLMLVFSQARGNCKNQRSALKLGASVLKMHRDWQEALKFWSSETWTCYINF